MTTRARLPATRRRSEYRRPVAVQRAIAINPRASSYFYVLASVYRKLGEAEESRQAMASFSKLEHETNELDQRRRDWVREEEQRAPAKSPEAVAHD